MSSTLWYELSVYAHILAITTWLGGTLFLTLVLVPLTRRSAPPPGSAARLLGQAARRFRTVAWVAIAVLVLSGAGNVLARGVHPLDIVTGSGWFFSLLRIKLLLVLLVVSLSALHDFVLGPQIARRLEQASTLHKEGDMEVQHTRRMLSWLARANLLLMLVIVALGVMLARGRPW